MRERSRWRKRDAKEEQRDDNAGRGNEGNAWWCDDDRCDERWWKKMVDEDEERREKMNIGERERERDVNNDGLKMFLFSNLFF